MPSSNQFKALATGGGANALTPTAYAALTSLLANGYQSGTASSQQINTTLRQTTFATAAIAQFIADTLGVAVNDDGVIGNFQAQLNAAIAAVAVAAIPPAFASGTRMTFVQSTPPTGWARDTSDIANNRMMRVVSSGGGGGGGSYDPTYNNVAPPHTHGFSGTTGGMNSGNPHSHSDAGHTHPTAWVNGGSLFMQASGQVNPGGTTGTGYANIQATDVNHGHYYAGSTDNGSSQTNWTPRYVDIIICSKL